MTIEEKLKAVQYEAEEQLINDDINNNNKKITTTKRRKSTLNPDELERLLLSMDE